LYYKKFENYWSKYIEYLEYSYTVKKISGIMFYPKTLNSGFLKQKVFCNYFKLFLFFLWNIFSFLKFSENRFSTWQSPIMTKPAIFWRDSSKLIYFVICCQLVTLTWTVDRVESRALVKFSVKFSIMCDESSVVENIYSKYCEWSKF